MYSIVEVLFLFIYFTIIVLVAGVLIFLSALLILKIIDLILSIVLKNLERCKEYTENKNDKEIKKIMFLPKYWCPNCNEFRSFWNTSSLDTGRECKCCHSRVRYTTNKLQEVLSKDCLEKKDYYLFNMDIDIMDKLCKIIDGRIAEYESYRKSIIPDDIHLSKKEKDNYYNMVALLSTEAPEIGTRDILYYTTDTKRFYLYSGIKQGYLDVTDSLGKRSK